MKLARIIVPIVPIVFINSISFAAQACTEFNVEGQFIGTESYNPNTLSPVVMQLELLLIDGPADSSCVSKVVDITNATTTGVRNFTDGTTTISGVVPPGQNVFSIFTETVMRLSPFAVSQLVSNGQIVIDYSWIEGGAFLPAGRYSNLLNIEVDQVPITIVEPEVIVEPAIRLYGDVSDGQGTVDFGSLESYEEISTNFVYQTNTKLNITALSENGGAMVHENGVVFGSVPYEAFIDNNPISTDGAQSLSLNSQIGRQNISTILLRIGDIGLPSAGNYADILTISFSAQ